MSNALISALIKDQFYAVDIGARGDIPKHWLPLDGVANIISFDADSETCGSLRQKYDSRGSGHKYEIHPTALGKANEKRTLYLAKRRGASSLYRPDSPFIKEYVNQDYCEVEHSVELPTRHAGEYFKESGITDVDLLKIDIQGAELEVLEALSHDLMSRILMIETEVQFHDRQNGAPDFCQLHHFLTAQGFALLDIDTVRHHPTTDGDRSKTVSPFGVALNSTSISRRVWYGDALYYRRAPADSAKLNNLVIALCLYGFFTEAYKVLQRCRQSNLIDDNVERELLSNIVEWHDKTVKHWSHGDSLLARGLSWLLKYLDLQERPVNHWSD